MQYVYIREYRQQYCIIVIELAKRLKLNYSNYEKDRIIMIEVLIITTIAILLQYINVSNEIVVYLKFT